MIELRKLTANDHALAQVAWHWMREQPERYRDCDGYDDFARFWQRPDEAKVAIFADGEMIAYAWVTFGPNSAEFGMVTPSAIPLWTLTRALRAMQTLYQRQYPELPLRIETANPAALRLSRRLGWTILSAQTAELSL